MTECRHCGSKSIIKEQDTEMSNKNGCARNVESIKEPLIDLKMRTVTIRQKLLSKISEIFNRHVVKRVFDNFPRLHIRDCKTQIFRFAIGLLVICVSIGYVKADVIWPTLIISQGMLSIPSITIGLIIEILFVKEYTDFNWIKSFYVGILLNAVSGVLGFFIIVLGGLPVAFIVDMITSSLPTQISNSLTELASYIFCIVVNVLLEGATLKSYFKKEFHETYKWLLYANIVSVSVAMASLAFTKHTIRF